jgi:hypothetical protein
MTTLADVAPITQILGNVLTGEPVAHGALTMVPLLAPALADPGWLTLAEAGPKVEISEVGEAGSVPELTLTSTADVPVLLLDGEELVGAKQNRVLNTSVLVAAGATLTLPVSCVERGRWHYSRRDFRSGDAALFASIRRAKAESVSTSIRTGRGHRSDQGQIWASLAARHAEHDVRTPTEAMSDFYAHHDEAIAAARAALAPRPGQVGAIVYIAGRWVGADLLASPGLFASAWPRLSAGYAADAVGARPAAKVTPGPKAVLHRIAACPAEATPAVGLGVEYRLGGLRTTGAGLVAGDRLAHLMAFPAPGRP